MLIIYAFNYEISASLCAFARGIPIKSPKNRFFMLLLVEHGMRVEGSR